MHFSSKKGQFVGLRGIASDVANCTRAEGVGAASAFFEVRFQLAGFKIVSRVLGRFIDVAEGEELIVAGYLNGKHVHPVAWWNCKKRTGYSPRVWEFWPCIVAMLVLLLVLMVALFRGLSRELAGIGLIMLLLAGVIYSAYFRRKAAKAVRDMRSGQIPRM